MAYEFDGNPDFKFAIDPELGDAKVIEEGRLDLPGWLWDGEKMLRQKYSRKKGYNGINTEYGETLYNIAEIQAYLTNINNVDMNKPWREKTDAYYQYYLSGCRAYQYPECQNMLPGLGENLGYGTFELAEIYNLHGWQANTIPIPDGWGGYIVKKTTGFEVAELKMDPVFTVIFMGSDGKVHIMFGDSDAVVPEENDPIWKTEGNLYLSDLNLGAWSTYYENH